jgi:uncharacterized protein involved in outer membrane biogenesis
MMKKVLIGLGVLILLLVAGVFFWARAMFAGDGVRTALAAQLSKSLGQPVTIGSVSAGVYPRVTIKLGEVAIGEPARINVETLALGTDFRALLSRRIEHARVDLSGARIELPLPAFTIISAPSDPSSKPPVELVSIDAIVLDGVEVVSGGRSLKGDIEIVPEGTSALTIRKVSLSAGDASVNVTGRISDIAGPVGDITVKAGALDVDQLLAFANDFASGSGVAATAPASPRAGAPPPTAAKPAGAPPMHIAMSLDADRATMGGLVLDKLSGKGQLTDSAMTLQPVSFSVFGGRCEGGLVFSMGATPDFSVNTKVAGVDVAAATAFAGTPGLMTGSFSGTLNLRGRGMDAASVMKTARGTARVDVANGTVKNLGLVRAVVTATSGRSDVSTSGGSRDEPFTRLSTTLDIADGSAATRDLTFDSEDLVLSAAGTLRLDGSAIDLTGQLQLSDALSQQAGRDLVRYTQQGGRVTLPATITGSAADPHVRLDVASMAKRAITNRANEEAQKAVKKGLRSLLKK